MDLLIVVAELLVLLIVLLGLNGLSNQTMSLAVRRGWLQSTDPKFSKLRQTISRSWILLWIFLTLLIIGFNGFLIQRGENLKVYTFNLFERIDPTFFKTLGMGLLKSVLLLLLVALALPVIRKTLHKIGDILKLNPERWIDVARLDRILKFIETYTLDRMWLLAVIGCAEFFNVPDSISKYLFLFLRVYAIVFIGLLILKVTNLSIDSLDAGRQKYIASNTLLRFYENLNHLIPFLKRCLEYIIYVSISTLVIQQFQAIAKFAELGSDLVQVIGIILFSQVLVEVAKLFVAEFLLKNKNLNEVQRQQRLTLVPLVQSILRYCIYFGAGIWILQTLSIDPTPIFAAAGLLGLAVGLGSQNLVNDVVSGFFILFENYYLVGDFIESGEVKGVVESIELRTTRVRHPNGQQYIIRNGDIKQIVNYSKQYIYAVVIVGVSYESDIDRVYGVLEEVGKQFCECESDVLEPTTVDGIDEFGEFAIILRTKTKVKPGTHLPVQRRLRKAIKKAFERENIEIPFPQYTLHHRDLGDRAVNSRSPQEIP